MSLPNSGGLLGFVKKHFMEGFNEAVEKHSLPWTPGPYDSDEEREERTTEAAERAVANNTDHYDQLSGTTRLVDTVNWLFGRVSMTND